MKQDITRIQLDQLIQLVKAAGADILQIYQQPSLTQATHKQDNSPLTAADLAAHKRLDQGLRNILDIPILSEESAEEDYLQRHQWQVFWLVDPLDGTREFLAQNGQFTVNVALIYQGLPLLGLVYQPVNDLLYLGATPHEDWEFPISHAWRQQGSQPLVRIECHSLIDRHNARLPLRCLVSQHHHSSTTDKYLEQLSGIWPAAIEKQPLGSSLKICAIAEGKADLYLRTGPTSEWDTAAAQAILEAAGGHLTRFTVGGKSFHYNQRDTLLNNDFCACTHPNIIIEWLLAPQA